MTAELDGAVSLRALESEANSPFSLRIVIFSIGALDVQQLGFIPSALSLESDE